MACARLLFLLRTTIRMNGFMFRLIRKREPSTSLRTYTAQHFRYGSIAVGGSLKGCASHPVILALMEVIQRHMIG